MDLLVAGDFAGLDAWFNDGAGRFHPATDRFTPEPTAAGMAHVLGDFNRDGLLDVFLAGMHSPTVDLLESLGLHRSETARPASMRAALMHGNRPYLGAAAGHFRQAALSAFIARSGWCWGCALLDLDNDG